MLTIIYVFSIFFVLFTWLCILDLSVFNFTAASNFQGLSVSLNVLLDAAEEERSTYSVFQDRAQR